MFQPGFSEVHLNASTLIMSFISVTYVTKHQLCRSFSMNITHKPLVFEHSSASSTCYWFGSTASRPRDPGSGLWFSWTEVQIKTTILIKVMVKISVGNKRGIHT